MTFLFLFFFIIVVNTIAFALPKRITKAEMYCISLFAICLNTIADAYLDIDLNYYGYFSKGADPEMFFVIVGVIPAYNILFLNFFPFGKRIKQQALYILGWSLLTIVVEWIGIKSGVFYHNNWKYFYSFLIYLPVYTIMVLQAKLFKYFLKVPR